MSNPRIVLASASPRRAELLAQLGVPFEVAPADIDEQRHCREMPESYVARLAQEKAQAGLLQAGLKQNAQATDVAAETLAVVIGSDTVVVLDDEILGKPGGQTEGETMLRKLSGRSHRVLTSVCVASEMLAQTYTAQTEVTFREVEAHEPEWYWHTGEPADKAGGYGIQGIGGIFVEEIRGSYSAVVGLPLVETRALLQHVIFKVCGIDIFREQLHG